MFSQIFKIATLAAGALSLAACENIKAPASPDDYKLRSVGGVQIMAYTRLPEGAPMVQIAVTPNKRCDKLANVTVWDQLSGTTVYHFCNAGHLGTAGTPFAQRDFYLVPNNGGAPNYAYSVAINCNLMEAYIKSAILSDGYADVCPA